jgi:hypothetical protein
MKVNMSMIKKKERASSHGLTAENTKVAGKTENSMAKAAILL